jgi:hypothetical protein
MFELIDLHFSPDSGLCPLCDLEQIRQPVWTSCSSSSVKKNKNIHLLWLEYRMPPHQAYVLNAWSPDVSTILGSGWNFRRERLTGRSRSLGACHWSLYLASRLFLTYFLSTMRWVAATAILCLTVGPEAMEIRTIKWNRDPK